MMMTAYLGFRPLDGEYKVMGLASYGNPKTYARQFEALFEETADGICRTTALVRGDFGEHVKDLMGPARKTADPVTQREMDIAAAAVYLSSNEAAYVTGQTIHVNGGMAMF